LKKNRKLNAIVTTEGENHYILSRSIPQVLLVHPILKYLLQLKKKGKLKEWLNKLQVEQPERIEIDGGLFASEEDVLYYCRYMQFLEEKKYFYEVEKYDLTPLRYTPGDAKKALANTLQIVFEVTEACNLNCKYCGYGELYSGFDKRENRNLDFDIARKLIDYITGMFESPLNRNHHKRIALSFYGGEPLLNMPLIKKIVKYAKQKKITHNYFYFTMTTNGILLDKHMEYLAANDFFISISIDGNEAHNEYRRFPDGSSSFKTIYSNVKKLKHKYPDYFRKSVNFISVMHDKNSDREVRQFFYKEFGKTPTLVQVNSLGIRPQKRVDYENLFKPLYSDLTPQDIVADTQKKDKILGTPFVSPLFSFIRQYSGFVFRRYNSLIYKKTTPWFVSNGTCDPFAKRIFLTTNGKILPCERIPQDYWLGTIDKGGVHLDFEEIAEKYNQLFSKIVDQCNKCFDSDVCKICMFTQEMDEDHPGCNFFLNHEKFKKNLFHQLSMIEETPQYYLEIMKHYQVN
jgi:uncharacterized protein